MDPPLVNEASFTASANPSSYSLAGLLYFPVNGGGGSAEVSTVTEQSGDGGGKRKRDVLGNYSLAAVAAASSKIGAVHHESVNESNVKRLKESEPKDENISLKTEADTNSRTSSKPFEEKAKPEPPKDYIHVRARRGQATDSHSLAERARREKISERMKILQDLVPGCNKVIGKALVLDEIINYIQSLQHQVEFLSMKLEAVNSGMNPTIEGFPTKDLTTTHQGFEANPMLYSPQTPREYTQRAQAEWLHMQLGSTYQGAT